MTKIHQMVAASAVALLALVATDARADYAATCAVCHAASGTPEVNFLPNGTGTSGSIRAANNLTYLNTKTTAGMGGTATANLTQLQRQAIVDEIGASPSVAAPVFTNSSAPGGSMTIAYSHTFTASGAPTLVGNAGLSAPFTLASGILPFGLTLAGSTGVLSGTPTASGTFTGSIRASNLIGAGPTQSFSITISKLTQSTLNAFASPSTVAYLGTSTLSTTGGDGTGAVTYSSNSSSCTINGAILTAQSGTGSCTITATKATDTNYLVATGTVIVTLTKASQATLNAFASPSTVAYLGTSTLSTTGGLGTGAVTYSSNSSSCTINGAILTAQSGTGSCTITATKAADTNYLATTATVLVTLTQASQATLNAFANPSTVPYLGTSTLSTTGGLGTGAVTYSSNSSSCTINGAILTAQSGTGSCTITATKAADTNYLSTTGTVIVTLTKASQATLNAFATPSTVAYLATSALSTTGGTGTGAVTYSSNSSSCTISASTLTAQASSGSCTITATKAADTNYLSTTGMVIVTLTQASQTISFGAQTSPLTFSQGGSFVISPLATGGASSSPVTYSSTTTGVCTVSGTTVSMVSGGGCTLAADQAADANYSAAPQVTQNVTINAVVPGAPIIGTAVAGNTQATISFTASASNGGSAITSYTATCTPSGTGTNTASPITVTGLTNTTTYTCSVRATNAIGNSAASGTVMVTPMKGSGIAPIIYLLFD